MNNFFTELAKSMDDKQIIDIRIQKTGEELTILSRTKNKQDQTACGTPEEMDAELLIHITAFHERTKGLKVKNSEPEEELDDDGEKFSTLGSETGFNLVKDKYKEMRENKEADKGKSKTHTEKRKEASKPASKKIVEKTKEIIAKEETTAKEIGEELVEAIKDDKVLPSSPKADPKTESARIDNEFKVLMHEGKKLFEDKSKGPERYQASLDILQSALKLKPEDKEAETAAANASKWVKMVAEL